MSRLHSRSVADDLAILVAAFSPPCVGNVQTYLDEYSREHVLVVSAGFMRSVARISEQEMAEAARCPGPRPLVRLVTRKLRGAGTNLRARVFRIGRRR